VDALADAKRRITRAHGERLAGLELSYERTEAAALVFGLRRAGLRVGELTARR
jgi:hypothetical protein